MFVDVKPGLQVVTDLVEKFEIKIKDRAFPCVGAKSALSRHRLQFLTVGDIRCPRDDRTIYDSLRDFVAVYRLAPDPSKALL